MKILYLNPSGQLGGAEAVLYDVLSTVRAAQPGWELALVLGEDGPLVGRAAALGVSVKVVPFDPRIARLGDAGAGGPAGRHVGKAGLAGKFLAAAPAVLRYRNQLRRATDEIRPDLIHSNGFKMHLLGLAARRGKTPVLWHVHDYVSQRPLMARLMRWTARGCARAVVNSRSVGADLKTLCPDLPVSTVLNGIDLERFSPTGARLDLDALSGLPPAPEGTVRIGLLGTMARWKGHATFLEALARVPASLPIRAYIVGGALYQTEGSQWNVEELRTMAAGLGLAGRVGFTGFVGQPAAAMRALDIVVHASTQPEPFGLVIAEAMACGKAVIASNAGGAGEIVRAGVNALVHAPGDVAQLADCMARLAESEPLRKQLGEAAASTAARYFDRTRMASELVPIYLEEATKTCESSISIAETSTAA